MRCSQCLIQPSRCYLVVPGFAVQAAIACAAVGHVVVAEAGDGAVVVVVAGGMVVVVVGTEVELRSRSAAR